MITAAQPTTITVTYERKFSDGNYGSEGLSLSMTFSREPEGFDPEELPKAARALRQAVLEQLAKSAAERVATMASHELNPPRPRQLAPIGAGTTADDLEEIPF